MVLVVFFTKKVGKQSLLFFVLGCILMQAFYFFPICLLQMGKNPYIWLFEYLFDSGPKRVNLNYKNFIFVNQKNLKDINFLLLAFIIFAYELDRFNN